MMDETEESDLDLKHAKILLLGLDNAGKTSILLSLRKNTNLLSYIALKPTAGLNIVNLEEGDKIYNIWDFGGQERYRKEYLKNLKKYFDQVDKIIFVIDVQDIDRYELALEYIKDIVEYIKNKGIKVDFSVFFHKFDPNLEKLDQFTEKVISTKLISKIKNIMPSKFNYKIFKTTIFTVFQKQLIL